MAATFLLHRRQGALERKEVVAQTGTNAKQGGAQSTWGAESPFR